MPPSRQVAGRRAASAQLGVAAAQLPDVDDIEEERYEMHERLAQAEEDAALIKANTIQHSSNGDHLKPRYDGDRAGLAYSAAIRANADRLRAEGEGEPK